MQLESLNAQTVLIHMPGLTTACILLLLLIRTQRRQPLLATSPVPSWRGHLTSQNTGPIQLHLSHSAALSAFSLSLIMAASGSYQAEMRISFLKTYSSGEAGDFVGFTVTSYRCYLTTDVCFCGKKRC